MKNLNIFLSFPGDDEYLTRAIKTKIEKCRGLDDNINDIYFCVNSNRWGEDWQKRLLTEIKKSDIFIFLWTKNSQLSMGQLIEVGAAWALEKNRLTVIHQVNHSTLPVMILNREQSISLQDFIDLDRISLMNYLRSQM